MRCNCGDLLEEHVIVQPLSSGFTTCGCSRCSCFCFMVRLALG